MTECLPLIMSLIIFVLKHICELHVVVVLYLYANRQLTVCALILIKNVVHRLGARPLWPLDPPLASMR